MENIELVAAIRLLKPNSQFSFTDNDYSTIKWDVLDGVAPTQIEIDAAIEQIKANNIVAETQAAANRVALLTRLGITADEFKTLLGGN
jgi:hypothetical protein